MMAAMSPRSDHVEETMFFLRCRQFIKKEDRELGMHVNARQNHPLLPQRFDVPDEHVDWSKPWPKYKPSRTLKKQAKVYWEMLSKHYLPKIWIGHDSSVFVALQKIRINPTDKSEEDFNFRSRQGFRRGEIVSLPNGRKYELIEAEQKLPNSDFQWMEKNPCGRTGLRGIGVLPRIGANKAVDPVITRSILLFGRKQTQVLVCSEKDSAECAFSLPGGILNPDEPSEFTKLPRSKRIKQFFQRLLRSKMKAETDGSDAAKVVVNKVTIDRHESSLAGLWKSGKKVFPNDRNPIGYCDDPRNTDDAWIETTVYHFHIGGAAEHTLLDIDRTNEEWKVIKGKNEKVGVVFRWLDVDNTSEAYRTLNATHRFFVDLCMPLCRCGRREFDRRDGFHRCLRYVDGARELARKLLAGVNPSQFDSRTSQWTILSAQSEFARMMAWKHKIARSKFPDSLPKGKKAEIVPEAFVDWKAGKDSKFFLQFSKAYTEKVVQGSDYDLTASTCDLESSEYPPYNGKNPCGRTGTCGLGSLSRWGPNWARDPVLTRVNQKTGRTQVLLLCKIMAHSKRFRLPGGMCEMQCGPMCPKQALPDVLCQVLKNNPLYTSKAEDELMRILNKGWRLIYPDGMAFKHGYCDDPRNTDDAWVETKVYHLHLSAEIGNLLDLDSTRPLSSPEDVEYQFDWIDAYKVIDAADGVYFASLSFFVELCVPLCQCGLPKFDTIDDSHAGDEGHVKTIKVQNVSPGGGQAQPEPTSKGPESCLDYLLQEQSKWLPSEMIWNPSALQAIVAKDTDFVLEEYAAMKTWGQIQFEGKPWLSTFVRSRVNDGSDALKVCQSLFHNKPPVGEWVFDEHCKFWRPRAIISVTGGAQDFNMAGEKARIEQIFTRGILKAAIAMKALVIDGGFSAGVMQEIGEAALRNDGSGNRVALLGVCPWGSVLERHNLLFTSHKEGQADGTKIRSYITSSEHSNSPFGAQLDPNHHLFVFVDRGLHGKESFGTEIAGRSYIESTLCGPTSDQNSADVTPHVMVVVNGGPGTIHTVHELAVKNAKYTVPIIVVDGSGKAADLFAATWRHLHANKEVECSHGFKRSRCISFTAPFTAPIADSKAKTVCCQHLRKLYCHHFNTASIDESLLEQVTAVCRLKTSVTVFNVDQDSSLCYAIMKGITRGIPKERGSNSLVRHLDLVMQWSDGEAVELARAEILDSMRYESSSSSALKPTLEIALIENKHEFVDLFLDSGVIVDDIARLYVDFQPFTKSAACEKWLPKTKPKEQKEITVVSHEKKGNGQVIETSASPVIKPGTENVPAGPAKQDGYNAAVEAFVRDMMGWTRFHSKLKAGDYLLDGQNNGATELNNFKNSEEVFLWSILNGRQEIAELYWRKCHPLSRQHCIARALFACAISKTLARSAYVSFELKKRLERTATRFEEIACGVLNLCQESSHELAMGVLTIPLFQPWLQFGSTWVDENSHRHQRFLTPMRLAHAAEALSFVKLHAFQACLAQVWYGRLQEGVYPRKEMTGSTAFRGTLVRLPEFSRFGVGHIVKSMFGFGGLMILEALYIYCCALCPFLILFLDLDVEKTMLNTWERAAHKVFAFYSAPITKFILAFASYVAFVINYTYVGFFMDHTYTVPEAFMHAWIFALIVAEVRQYLLEGRFYLKAGSNKVDVLMLAVYIPSFMLRMYELYYYDIQGFNCIGGYSAATDSYDQLPDGMPASYQFAGEDFLKARSWHGIAGIFFWVRIFDYLRVSYSLGPLWLVLVKVSMDVFHFFIFLFVFLISFGAAIICATRPRHDPAVHLYSYLEDAVYFPYFEIFGEHFLDQIYFSAHPRGADVGDNRKLGTILLCLYLFISAIVLTNLLIAKMNSTYNDLFNQSKEKWQLQRLELILEYSSSSIFPPPFGILQDILVLCFPKLFRNSRLSPKGVKKSIFKQTAPTAPPRPGKAVSVFRSFMRGTKVRNDDGKSDIETQLPDSRIPDKWFQWSAGRQIRNVAKWYAFIPKKAVDETITQHSKHLRKCSDAINEALTAWICNDKKLKKASQKEKMQLPAVHQPKQHLFVKQSVDATAQAAVAKDSAQAEAIREIVKSEVQSVFASNARTSAELELCRAQMAELATLLRAISHSPSGPARPNSQTRKANAPFLDDDYVSYQKDIEPFTENVHQSHVQNGEGSCAITEGGGMSTAAQSIVHPQHSTGLSTSLGLPPASAGFAHPGLLQHDNTNAKGKRFASIEESPKQGNDHLQREVEMQASPHPTANRPAAPPLRLAPLPRTLQREIIVGKVEPGS